MQGKSIFFRLYKWERRGREINAQNEKLIHQAVDVDDMDFHQFVDKYRTYIFHIAYSILRNAEDAEDAAQEIFIQIYVSLPEYRNEGLGISGFFG